MHKNFYKQVKEVVIKAVGNIEKTFYTSEFIHNIKENFELFILSAVDLWSEVITVIMPVQAKQTHINTFKCNCYIVN